MLHYAFLLALMVFGVSSAGFAQSINVTDAEAEQAPQTKIAAAKANEDIAKIDDVSTLLRGVLAFECKLGGDSFPLVLLEKRKGWTMPSAPDLVLTEIDDGFAFNQSDDPLYLGFLKERVGQWKLTELDDGGITTGTCEERDEMLEDVTEIIAPRILQNALDLQNRVAEAEDRMAAMQSRLDGAGLALCKEPPLDETVANKTENCPTLAPEIETAFPKKPLATVRFFEFPAILTGNLKGVGRVLDLGIGVLTQDDGTSVANIETHMPELSQEVIATMGTYTEQEVTGREAREVLAEDLRITMNATLISLTGVGGIDKVHFTFFAIE